MNRENDWFAANLNQPDFGFDQMFASGITPDNTTLKDKEFYKGIKQVQNKFTDKSGKFDDDAFNDYYDSLKRSYNEFSTMDFESKLLKNMESSPYDIFSLDNPNTFDASVKMIRNSDPQRHQIGMGGLNVIGEPSWDEREVAQENWVRDENGNKLNWTPNKKWLGNIFGPTLVKAAWDEDGYHEENGIQVFHRKGQAKYDENGDPYYELLGKRSIYGKDVLHVSDVITKDDTWINNLDFIDSDSLDKSAMKTIVKTAATIGMWAIPYVGPWLGSIKAVMDLTSVLPVVGKSIDSFVAGDTNNDFGKAMNQWEGFMARFDKSQTQYAKENQWSFENIGDMLASSAGQLYSQRLIGQIPLLFKKNAKDLANLQKIGQKLSLGYMALTSAEDSYRDFKDAGANDVTAGLGFLAIASAMFGLMNIDYFKEWLFKNSALGFDPEMRFAWRQFSKEKIAEISKDMEKAGLTMGKKAATDAETKFVLKKWYNSAKDFVKKYAEYIPTGKAYPMTAAFANHALNEGIEEVMEEGATDIVKGIANAADALGLNVTEKDVDGLDFGFSVEDMTNRYLTSFVGGALGGAVFEGLTRWENYWRGGYGKTDNLLDKSAKNRIIWYIANGHKDALKKALEREHDKGNLGDKNLTFDFEETTDAAGNKKFVSKPVSANGQNQNDQMYLRLSDMLNTLEYEAATLGILDSDEQIMNHLLTNDSLSKAVLNRMKEEASKEGISLDEFKRRHLTSLSQQVMAENGVIDAIFSDVYSLKDRILSFATQIKNREDAIREGETDSTRSINDAKIENDPALNRWREELKKAQNEYKDLMSGNKASEYIGLAYFSHNDGLRRLYLAENEDDLRADNDVAVYALQRYGVNYESLEQEEKDMIQSEHSEFIKKQRNPLIREAYNIHKNMMDIVNGKLSEKQSEYTGYKMDTGLEDATFSQFLVSLIAQNQQRITELQAELSETGNTALTDEIAVLQEDNDRYQRMVQNMIPSMLNRAASVSEDTFSDNFEMFLPKVLTDTTNVSLDQISRAMTTLENYLNYLKRNKIIRGEDNPVVNNVLRTIARSYLNAALNSIEGYKARSVNADVDDALNQALQIILSGEEFTGDINALPEYAKKIVLARKLRRLRENTGGLDPNLLVGQEGWEQDDIDFLNNRKDISDEEINSILNPNGAEFTELNQKLASLGGTNINDATRRLFAQNEAGVYIYTTPGQLLEKITSVVSAIESGNNNLDEKLNDLRSYIEQNTTDETVKQELLDTFVTPLEGLSQQISDAKQTEADLRPSPIADLLEWIDIETNGTATPLIDFLRRQYKGIDNQTALDKYEFGSQDLKNQIARIQTLFPVIKAILASARRGSFNEEHNLFREKDGDEPLVVLDDDQYIMYVRELNYIENKLKQLVALDGAHVQSNSDKQIDDQINMRPKFLRRFIGDVHVPGIPKKLKELGIDTDAIWKRVKQDVDEDDVNRDNYKDYFEAILRWESAVYDEFWDKFKDKPKEEIGELIGKCFNITNDGGAYSGNEDEEVTDMGAALYFLSVIGYKDFQALFKSKLNRDGDYPFDSQEMAIRIGFASVLNKEIFNSMMKGIKSHASDDGTITDTLSLLQNVLVMLGENGTGKSKICMSWVIDLLKSTGKSVGVIASTMFGTTTEGRLSELPGELNIDPSNVKPLSEVIAKINDGKQFTKDDYIQRKSGNGRVGQLSDDRLSQIDGTKLLEFYGNEEIKILAIDEGTFATQAELQAIAKAASDAGIFVIINGDLNQQYATVDYNVYDDTGKITGTAKDTSGLEDCRYAATPRLTASMRVAYQGKRINGNAFNDVINPAVKQFKNDPSLSTMEIIPTSDIIDIDLQYTEEGNAIYGDKVIESSETVGYINKLKESGTVVIITDDEDKYSALAGGNVSIFKPTEVQGREFDFAVVDVDLSNELYKPYFSRIKAVNTWLSRARKGAVIVSKPELQEDHFKINSHNDPDAGRSVDSIVARPEEIDAYKDFVDGVYSSVGAPVIPEPGTTPTPAPITPPPAASTTVDEIDTTHGFTPEEGKTVDEVIAEVKAEVLSGSDNNNGYHDEDHYREHTAILSDSGKRVSMTYNGFSLEGFWRWLFSDESNDILFTETKWNPIKSDLSDRKKQDYKRLVRDVIYAITSSPDPKDTLERLEVTIQTLANNLFKNTSGREFYKLLQDGLNNVNNSFSAFKVISDKEDSSFIWFVFGNKSGKTFAIPLGRTTKLLQEGTYKSLNFTQKIPMSQITSKGRVHLPLHSYDEKVHRHQYGGIFIAPKLDSYIYVPNLSDAAKRFSKSRGRTYNVFDLMYVDAVHESTNSEHLFSPQMQGGKIVDFTEIGSDTQDGATTRLSGTQAIVDFSTYLEAARALQVVAFGYNDQTLSAETIKRAKAIVKSTFKLEDEDIALLETPYQGTSGSEQAAVNKNRYELLKRCELLNPRARARFASAIFRLCSNWFALDARDPKFKFASRFLTNIIGNYLVRPRGDNDFGGFTIKGAQGTYKNGIKLTFTGDNGAGRVYLDLFVYADENGNLYYEAAQDRVASKDPIYKSDSTIGSLKDFLNGEKGLDLDKLINAIIKSPDPKLDAQKGSFATVFGVADNLTAIENLVQSGDISILPAKRYNKDAKPTSSDPDDRVERIRYYDCFDNDIAGLIPEDHDGIYASVDAALRTDPIFKYGLYLSDHSDYFPQKDNNTFALTDLTQTNRKYTTDIADVMLPMYSISVGESVDTDVQNAIKDFGNFGLEVSGATTNDGIVVTKKNNTYSFGNAKLIVDSEKIKEVIKSNDVEDLENAGIINDDKPLLVTEIKRLNKDQVEVTYSINNSKSTATLDLVKDVDLDKWIMRLGVQSLNDTKIKEFGPKNNQGWFALDGDNLVLRYKRNDNDDFDPVQEPVNLLGYSKRGTTNIYYLWNGNKQKIVSIEVDTTTMDEDLELQLSNIVRDNMDFGVPILNDFGFYFFKDNTITVWEGIGSDPVQRNIVTSTSDEIILDDGAVISKELDPDLFFKIKSSVEASVVPHNAKLRRIGNTYFVSDGTISMKGSFVMSNYDVLQGENYNASDVNIISISDDGLTLTVESTLDGSRYIIKSKTDSNILDLQLKSVNKTSINHKVGDFLNNEAFDAVRDVITEELAVDNIVSTGNESQIISRINECLSKYASRIGAKYELTQNWLLSKSSKPSDLIQIAIDNYDFGEQVSISNLEISGKSGKFLVTLQDGTVKNYQAIVEKNGNVKIDQVSTLTEASRVAVQIKQQIKQNISNKTVSDALYAYSDSIVDLNIQIPDELDSIIDDLNLQNRDSINEMIAQKQSGAKLDGIFDQLSIQELNSLAEILELIDKLQKLVC